MSAPEQARALRRRRKRERQAAVFGVLLVALALVTAVSAAVFTGALTIPVLARGFASPASTKAALPPQPCPPEGALPVPYGQVAVTVLNGTTRSGLATTVASELQARGFAVAGTGNATRPDSDVGIITAGRNGVAAAYTLAAHVQDARVQLDDRQDSSVSLTLGPSFSALVDPAAVELDPNESLSTPAGCRPVEVLATQPAAPTAAPAAGG